MRRSKFDKDENRWFRMIESHMFAKMRKGVNIKLTPVEEAVADYYRTWVNYDDECIRIKRKIIEKFYKK